VIVGANLLDDIGTIVGKIISPSRCAIISDTNVAPIFSERIQKSLTNSGFDPLLIEIPAGEQSKSFEQVAKICDQMIAAGLDRQSFVVGLGGGVIGDISGFVAAIFHRGIPHVQIPTTLLAMVDSSIGGKTGVNTHAGKNLIGAVHQPTLVIDDVDVLKSLPPREFNQGFAEIIKHAIIADAGMFEELKEFSASDPPSFGYGATDAVALQRLIKRNIEIKAKIVAKDEHDRAGERALLNFGHTIGHGIEQAGDFRQFLHGEAISLGMVAACSISTKRAGLTNSERSAIVDLLSKFNLPTRLPEKFPRPKILEALKFDKKFEGGEIRFVITPKIGSAYLSRDITLADIREAVEEL
jgi:3-dehydroquinate synthase